MPAFRFPKVALPTWRWPSVRLPKIKLPSLAGLRKTAASAAPAPRTAPRLRRLHFPKIQWPAVRLDTLRPGNRFRKIAAWLNSPGTFLPPLRRLLTSPSFFIPSALVLLSFAVILLVPRLSIEQPRPQPSEVPHGAPATKSTRKAAATRTAAKSSKATSKAGEAVRAKKKSAPAVPPSLQTVSPAPATTEPAAPADLPTKMRPAPEVIHPETRNSNGPRGAVLQQVLPSISQGALDTIRGTVRIAITVHVSPSGNVLDASFVNPGPSKTFAALAIDAARQWQFTPPVSNGDALPSDWLLNFAITQTGVTVSPQQSAP